MALTSGTWKTLAVTVVACFFLLLSWSPSTEAGPVKEVKRSADWKLPEDYKYEGDISRPASSKGVDVDDYSGLSKQKLVRLIARLILERKALAQQQNKVFDESIQPAKRQRSLFAGDRGGWGGGYGK